MSNDGCIGSSQTLYATYGHGNRGHLGGFYETRKDGVSEQEKERARDRVRYRQQYTNVELWWTPCVCVYVCT